ncbi:MAG: TIGR00341 family protein [Pseudomonadales bacterium]|nr:TIGR00341 family protein [Pseudomonadales bacterium]
MKYIEVVAPQGSADTIKAIAESVKAYDIRLGEVGEDGLQQMRLLVGDSALQKTLDNLQSILGGTAEARIVVLEVKTSLPRSRDDDRHDAPSAVIRESLYDDVARSSRFDRNYLLLVVLSTVVAAIGLIENNVTVVVGAMVIAPLLGPNLALSLGAALGDIALVKEAVKSLVVGVLLAVSIAFLAGFFWPESASPNTELMSRTLVGIDAVVLALASGAAAALSLTTGLSSVLVGVMVAAALLPPAATIGIMLSQGSWHFALSAAVLLAVNIAALNLASKVVFLAKGIGPRTWVEKEKVKHSMAVYLLSWVLLLLMVVVFMILPQSLTH